MEDQEPIDLNQEEPLEPVQMGHGRERRRTARWEAEVARIGALVSKNVQFQQSWIAVENSSGISLGERAFRKYLRTVDSPRSATAMYTILRWPQRENISRAALKQWGEAVDWPPDLKKEITRVRKTRVAGMVQWSEFAPLHADLCKMVRPIMDEYYEEFIAIVNGLTYATGEIEQPHPNLGSSPPEYSPQPPMSPARRTIHETNVRNRRNAPAVDEESELVQHTPGEEKT